MKNLFRVLALLAALGIAPVAWAGPQSIQITDKTGTNSAPVDSVNGLTVTCVSGCASGGGTTAVSIADGADVTLGSKADSATCAVSNTDTACFRQLHADITASIPSGTNVIGYTTADPCSQGTKLMNDFSSATSGGAVITGVASKKAYLCSISIVSTTAQNVSLTEGTTSGTACGGSTAGLFLNTGGTAANGAAFAANGGIQAGNGSSTVAVNATAANNVCVLFSGGGQVNVHVAYVSAP